jgi:1-acyl-sn-glycerol-3-phosphate acyltransferase
MEHFTLVRYVNTCFQRIFAYSTAFLIRSFWLGKIEGLRHIPATPSIIISNHESYLDFLLLGYVFKKKANLNFSFWAKSKVRNHFVWKIYSNIFSTIEVNGSLRKLNELSQQSLESGKHVCIFPEGKRTRNGELQPFMKGYLRLASTIGIEVIPVFLKNTYGAWPSHKLFPKFQKCNITFYPSIKIPVGLTEEEIDEINLDMMKKYEGFRNKSHDK